MYFLLLRLKRPIICPHVCPTCVPQRQGGNGKGKAKGGKGPLSASKRG